MVNIIVPSSPQWPWTYYTAGQQCVVDDTANRKYAADTDSVTSCFDLLVTESLIFALFSAIRKFI